MNVSLTKNELMALLSAANETLAGEMSDDYWTQGLVDALGVGAGKLGEALSKYKDKKAEGNQ